MAERQQKRSTQVDPLFLESKRNEAIMEKGELHDLSTDKMLFAVKRSDYFLC